MREKAMGSVISNESVVSASVEDASDWYVLERVEGLTPMNLSENLPFSIGLSSQGKSTSLEARRLLEADQRIGQTEKGQIAPGELVPANDEPPIVLQPSVPPLNDPVILPPEVVCCLCMGAIVSSSRDSLV
jgi:hypothetical protein